MCSIFSLHVYLYAYLHNTPFSLLFIFITIPSPILSLFHSFPLHASPLLPSLFLASPINFKEGNRPTRQWFLKTNNFTSKDPIKDVFRRCSCYEVINELHLRRNAFLSPGRSLKSPQERLGTDRSRRLTDGRVSVSTDFPSRHFDWSAETRRPDS